MLTDEQKLDALVEEYEWAGAFDVLPNPWPWQEAQPCFWGKI